MSVTGTVAVGLCYELSDVVEETDAWIWEQINKHRSTMLAAHDTPGSRV